MTQNKQTLQQTTQLIVDILSFETSDVVLEHYLANTIVDWDAIVIVASKHLVLPAVYCRLKQKSLLEYLPEDLRVYLEALTQLNRDRNLILLNEVEQISKLFAKHRIQHVFIKGIALLAGNYFEDLGERMIGDIDILVASEDIDTAFELLISEGYNQFLSFDYEVKHYRHLPRQLSENHIGAIELHDQLLKHGYNHLINKDLYLSHRKIINGIAISNSDQLIWNTILAHQINDRCYYYNILKLKGVYDVMAAGLVKKQDLITELSKNTYSLGFLGLTSVFCPKMTPSKKNVATSFNIKFFLLALKFRKFGWLSFKTKAIYAGIKERFGLFFFNKSYREHIVKNKLFK